MNITQVKGIIYSIKCTVTGKYYVGQTLSHRIVDGKWIESGITYRLGKHIDRSTFENYPLYIDLNKHGIQNFKVSEEFSCNGNDIAVLDDKEGFYIKKYKSMHPTGYNMTNATTTMSKSKKELLKHYKIHLDRTKDYRERKRRVRQITIPFIKDSERKSFFDDKDIEKIVLKPIKSGGNLRYVRVIVHVRDFENLYRVQYTNKDILVAAQRAIKFAKSVCSTIDIHPQVKMLLDGIKKMVYEYQNRLDKLDGLVIKNIVGSAYYQKSIDNYIYLVIVKTGKKKEEKRFQFGGRRLSIEDAYVKAQEFVSRICCDVIMLKPVHLVPNREH